MGRGRKGESVNQAAAKNDDFGFKRRDAADLVFKEAGGAFDVTDLGRQLADLVLDSRDGTRGHE